MSMRRTIRCHTDPFLRITVRAVAALPGFSEFILYAILHARGMTRSLRNRACG